MAKRIQLYVPGVRLNETGFKALAFIAERARAASGLACRPVPISRRELCDCMGVSSASCFRTCKALEASGLIESSESALENGARVANTYNLTALGIEILRLAEEAVATGKVGCHA